MAEAHNPRKRGRGSSTAMEEEWRDLGLAVPGTLMPVGTSEEALRLIDLAGGKLAACADAVRMLRAGTTVSDIRDVFTDPEPAGVCPTEVLEGARREIARLRATHAMAGHVFALYGAHLGLQGDPLWQSWDDRRAEAAHHANAAVQRVLSAVSHVQAGIDIIRVARASCPFPHLRLDSWIPAEEQVASGAVDEVAMALDEVRQMRHAVVLEFFEAWMILNR